VKAVKINTLKNFPLYSIYFLQRNWHMRLITNNYNMISLSQYSWF